MVRDWNSRFERVSLISPEIHSWRKASASWPLEYASARSLLRVSRQVHPYAGQCTLPDNTHRGPHQRLAAVGIVGDAVEELEDGRDVGLEDVGYRRACQQASQGGACGEKKVHTLATALHGANNATPRIHDALAQSNNIVVHLVRPIGASRDSGRLLQHLRDDSEVRLKVPADGAGNVTKALQDGRLELIGKGSALKKKCGLAISSGHEKERKSSWGGW